MSGLKALLAIALVTLWPMAAMAQDTSEAAPTTDTRAETGGAQTLEDILRRQRGEDVDNSFRRDAVGNLEGGAPATNPLGTLGGASDPELWRAMRFGEADVTSQVRGPGATLLIQDSGMAWLQFREGPLRTYGGYFLLGVIALLALFFLIRGRIRIEHGKAGVTIERFKAVERFGHWLLAGSFILLGITGLITLFGRNGLMEWIGRENYATIALWSKWVHNNVSWAFMLGLVMVFVMWVFHNLPSREDLTWIAKGGGIVGKGHPPARKFNAGQKLIFWSVILLGASISVSGLALIFPFELQMFAPTFSKLNAFGIPGWFGMDPLPETLTPHAEMQLAQTWHAIVSFVLMGIILAHIYIGSLGMEGAYDAMGSGDVDLNWAKEHHSLWVDEVQARDGKPSDQATPAE
ncbi:MAG: formate dehydrogenase subunit gamma [Boseongicola sp.]|nr:formate dehydrogenase subunit gamma [Boseongicola sp.]